MKQISKLILILFFSTATLCKAEHNVIDSCELSVIGESVFPSCNIKIRKDGGYIDRKEVNDLVIPISADTCALMINRLNEFLIEKKYPMIKSQKRTDEYMCADYPFLNITIYYKGKKLEKLLYVACEDGNYIYQFSDGFAELWGVIEKIVYDFRDRQRSMKYRKR